jgi:hypothetical protein
MATIKAEKAVSSVLSKNHRWNIFDGFPFRDWSVPAIKPDINAVLKSSEKKRIKDVILETIRQELFRVPAISKRGEPH